MTDDIVTRLRDVVCWCNEFDGVCDACQAAAEIERLRRWKTEAITVLAEWDAVWECAGKGTVGELKQRGVVAELGRLNDEIERLRAVLDAVADLHEPSSVDDPRCASCGDWPCPTHLIMCDECKEARRG